MMTEFHRKKWRITAKTSRLRARARQYLLPMIIDRDGTRCFWCQVLLRTDDDTTLDHLIPRSLGGPNYAENLVLSCKDCNSQRGDSVPSKAVCDTVRNRTRQLRRRAKQLPESIRPKWLQPETQARQERERNK